MGVVGGSFVDGMSRRPHVVSLVGGVRAMFQSGSGSIGVQSPSFTLYDLQTQDFSCMNFGKMPVLGLDGEDLAGCRG